MISVDEESLKNIKMKKIVEKRFSKKTKNLDTIMFEIIDVNYSNAEFFIKYHINDTTTISNSFTKFFFEFENSLKKENATQAHEKEQKKKEFKEKRRRELRKNEEEENR